MLEETFPRKENQVIHFAKNYLPTCLGKNSPVLITSCIKKLWLLNRPFSFQGKCYQETTKGDPKKYPETDMKTLDKQRKYRRSDMGVPDHDRKYDDSDCDADGHADKPHRFNHTRSKTEYLFLHRTDTCPYER